jgi:hypothetical protein
MPLVEGKGKAKISANIEELMASYKAHGKIGNWKPKGDPRSAANMAKAREIASGIAYSKARGE